MQSLTEQALELSVEKRLLLIASIESTLSAIRHPHIAQTPGVCGGRPTIKGTRVPVKALINYHHMGYQPAEILAGYPGIGMAQFYDALSYYYDYQAEIDADIEADKPESFLKQFNLVMDEDGTLIQNSEA
ncbi:MAG: DUF433 domain-containing protein [Cyanobacteria bacterium J06628_6]